MQPLRQVQAVEDPGDGTAAGKAETAAEHRLSRSSTAATCDQLLLPESRISTSTMVRKIANGSFVPDSTSSVARNARPQPQAAGMDQEEHGRRVGRGHDRADQQRLGPAEAE